MAKKRYVTNLVMILGTGLVLLMFMFILVSHHREVPDRVRLDRGPLLADGSSVTERIRPVGEIAFATAEKGQAPAKDPAPAKPAAVRDGLQVYQSTCVACHDAGIAGAPKLGDKGQWAKRIGKGRDALYASALNGVLQGGAGVMPPRGGNPALSDAEVKAAVDYMVAQSR